MKTYLGVLLALFLGSTLSLEDEEPVFRAVGGEMQIGFCFGVDYIVVYKLSGEGQQLLGNSSDESGSISQHAEYKDRVSIADQSEGLLGLVIQRLKISDTGVYLRECWRDTELVNHRKHYLHVCGEEVKEQEISLRLDGSAELVCSASSLSQAGRTLRWYREVYPSHKTSLFLDTKDSLEPLQDDLKGLVQVQDEGFSLQVQNTAMELSQQFTCLVMENEQCLAFQNINLPEKEQLEVKSVFRAVGERVVLPCSSRQVKHIRNYWETPVGNVNSMTAVRKDGPGRDQMHILNNYEEGNYSLLIQSLTLNHTGDYRCFSPTLAMEYTVSVCSELETVTAFSSPGKRIVLECDPDRNSTSVLWYRQHSGQDQLIMDSGDTSMPIPGDLNDRVEFSEEDFSLTISKLTPEDSGIYWCVVLQDSQDYPDDLDLIQPEEDSDGDTDKMHDDLGLGELPKFIQPDDEGNGDNNSIYEDLWLADDEYADECLFRRVTHLKINGRMFPVEGAETTSKPEAETSSVVFVICGVVIVVLLLAAVVAVLVVKMRAKKKPSRGEVELSDKSKEDDVSKPLAPVQNHP